MNFDGLRITFIADGDGIGQVTAHVQSGDFRGCGIAWFDQSLLISFAQEIRSYPLTKTHRPRIEGSWGHLDIEVYPVGIRGQVGVRVVAATKLGEYDRPEAQKKVEIELLSTYQRLDRFGKDLVGVVDGSASEAVLGEEVLA